MNWSVFGKAFLVETVYSIPFFILSILPFKKQLRFPIKILILFIFIGQLLQSSLYTYLISHGKPTGSPTRCLPSFLWRSIFYV